MKVAASAEPPPGAPSSAEGGSGLARRLLLAVVLFSSLITAVITALDLHSAYRRDMRAIEGAFDFVGENYLPALVNSVWAYDERQVRSQLDALVKLPDVEFVGVAVDNRMQWSVGQVPQGRKAERRLPLRHAAQAGGLLVGELHIVANVDTVLDRVWDRLFAVLLGNAIKTALVAIFLLGAFHLMVTRHLVKQARFMRAVGRDGTAAGVATLALDRRAHGLWRPDVLDVQTQAINAMLASLRNAQAELVRSQAAQAESALRLRTGLEAASAGIWEWQIVEQRLLLDDSSCRLVGVDRLSAVDAEGLAPHALSLREFEQRFHADDWRRAQPEVTAALASGALFRIDLRARRHEGWRWVHWRGKVVARDDAGRALRAFGTIGDVHQRKLAQEALEAMNVSLEQRVADRTKSLQQARDEALSASRAKSEFLSRMSHELRTPLNAVLGFAQIIGMAGVDPKAVSWAKEIQRAGEHLLRLIEELLDLSRIEVGKLAISAQALALGPIVQEAFDLVRAALPDSTAPLQWQPEPGLPAVVADPLRLRQVLVNLLTNAIKYNRDEAAIEVRARVIAGRMHLEVADRGIGIPRERAAELFEPFARLGRENSEVSGVGIGLSLSRRLTELMGGQLGFSAQPEQGGSVFWIDLPLASAKPLPPAAIDPSTLPEPAAAEVVVLYVEDNAANRQMIQDYFALHPGWRLVWAETGQRAIELAPHTRPQLVLLDINLPDISGYEVAEALRRDPATRDVPVVAVSADAMPADLDRGAAAGFAGYLTKPVSLAELARTIARLVPVAADVRSA